MYWFFFSVVYGDEYEGRCDFGYIFLKVEIEFWCFFWFCELMRFFEVELWLG